MCFAIHRRTEKKMFFFSSRRRQTRSDRDWSSDVCSSDLLVSGGSFGRRANVWSDFTVAAVNVAKAIDGRAPVRLQFSREDDTSAGLYRPMYVHAVKAGLDAQGRVTVWEHTIVGQSIMAGGP